MNSLEKKVIKRLTRITYLFNKVNFLVLRRKPSNYFSNKIKTVGGIFKEYETIIFNNYTNYWLTRKYHPNTTFSRKTLLPKGENQLEFIGRKFENIQEIVSTFFKEYSRVFVLPEESIEIGVSVDPFTEKKLKKHILKGFSESLIANYRFTDTFFFKELMLFNFFEISTAYNDEKTKKVLKGFKFLKFQQVSDHLFGVPNITTESLKNKFREKLRQNLTYISLGPIKQKIVHFPDKYRGRIEGAFFNQQHLTFSYLIEVGSIFLKTVSKLWNILTTTFPTEWSYNDTFSSRTICLNTSLGFIFIPQLKEDFLWKDIARHSIFICPILKDYSSNTGIHLNCGHLISNEAFFDFNNSMDIIILRKNKYTCPYCKYETNNLLNFLKLY